MECFILSSSSNLKRKLSEVPSGGFNQKQSDEGIVFGGDMEKEPLFIAYIEEGIQKH